MKFIISTTFVCNHEFSCVCLCKNLSMGKFYEKERITIPLLYFTQKSKGVIQLTANYE